MAPLINPSITPELMEILNRINDNVEDVKERVNDVKERVIHLESQNHAENLKNIWEQLDREREKRTELEIELASIKTKLAPIIITISMAGAALIEMIINSFNH